MIPFKVNMLTSDSIFSELAISNIASLRPSFAADLTHPCLGPQDGSTKMEVPNTQVVKPCHDCRGYGDIRCGDCNGRGHVSDPEEWCGERQKTEDVRRLGEGKQC